MTKIIRTPTGIINFDKICEGGFVKGSVNTILGGPGSGKTTFLLQYLWNGLTQFSENGAYISFEPEISELLKDAEAYGWDFSKYIEKGKCQFLRISPKITINELKNFLSDLVLKHNIQRLCIDPITVFSINIEKSSQIRETVFDFTNLLKKLDVTVILAEETTEVSIDSLTVGSSIERTEYVKFLSDGIINFYSMGLGGTTDRALRIPKMRRTNQKRGPIPFEITDSGIIVKK